ncbi:magnesium transporter MRS2-5-like [Wolffia australiana]
MDSVRRPARRLDIPKPASVDSGLNFSQWQRFTASNVKKRGQGTRSWTQIDREGNSRDIILDKGTMMKRCSLPSRDLRLLDPLFYCPSTILSREKAIVVNLEKIRCIITADEVILMNSGDGPALQFVSELCFRLKKNHTEDLPFEFQALELALEMACALLDGQVNDLEVEIYSLLEELASSISTTKLDQVRRLKTRLLALTHRVQKVRDELENLLDDDGDMAEMYLSEKQSREEEICYVSLKRPKWTLLGIEPVASKASSCSSRIALLEKTPSSKSSDSAVQIEELEMLLEAYFVIVDNTSSNLQSLKEYIDDTEDFINIKLDNVQNQLIQIGLLLSGATFVVAAFTVVTAVFGMNFADPLFDRPSNFGSALVSAGFCCGLIYVLFLLYVKHRKLLHL